MKIRPPHPCYRVLWRNLAGDLYAHDRSTMMAAIREAISLLKSEVSWQDVRIHDTKAGVMWSASRPGRSGEGR